MVGPTEIRMTRGYLIFAHNNEEIDYTLIALCNALMIRRHSVVKNVTLVTNQGSLDWLRKSHGPLVNLAFQHIIIRPQPDTRQTRAFADTSTAKKLKWHNGSRASAYELSPYRETILLDADYLVQDASLDHVWGVQDDFLMNRQAQTLDGQPLADQEARLEPYGIPLYWATCVFFRKGDTAQRMFEMVEHVKENYDYYQNLYRFPGSLFRNDYAFSIAAHLIGGWTEGAINSLPSPVLLTSFDRDELIDVKDGLIFLVAQDHGFAVSRIAGVSVHVMNKFSIIRMADKLLEVYREDV
jgi:hypothetical protein